MTAIAIEIFPDAEAWLRENMPDMVTDTVAAVRPVGEFTMDAFTKYEDVEEGTTKDIFPYQHREALQKLCEQIGRTLFVGDLTSPFQLVDPANWDVEVVDAYWQLVYHGEVIYG
jgi:hypothetical protein